MGQKRNKEPSIVRKNSKIMMKHLTSFTLNIILDIVRLISSHHQKWHARTRQDAEYVIN